MKIARSVFIFMVLNFITLQNLMAGPAIGGGANTVQASRGYLNMDNTCRRFDDSEQTKIPIDEFIKPVNILPGYRSHLIPKLERLKELDSVLHGLLIQKIEELVFYWNVPVDPPDANENIHGYRFQNAQTKWQYPGRRVFLYSGKMPCQSGVVDGQTISTLIVHEAVMRAKLILGNGVINPDDTTDVTELTAAILNMDQSKFERAKWLLSVRIVTGITNIGSQHVDECAPLKEVNAYLDYTIKQCSEAGLAESTCFREITSEAKKRMPESSIRCFAEIAKFVDQHCSRSGFAGSTCNIERATFLKLKMTKP